MLMKITPPYYFIIKIIKSASDLCFVYFYLWEKSSPSYQTIIVKEEIYQKISVGPWEFSGKLFQLKNENVLDYKETSTLFEIQLFLPEINAEGKTLC